MNKIQSEDLKHDEEERRSDTEAAIKGAARPSLGELLESAQHQHKVLHILIQLTLDQFLLKVMMVHHKSLQH